MCVRLLVEKALNEIKDGHLLSPSLSDYFRIKIRWCRMTASAGKSISSHFFYALFLKIWIIQPGNSVAPAKFCCSSVISVLLSKWVLVFDTFGSLLLWNRKKSERNFGEDDPAQIEC